MLHMINKMANAWYARGVGFREDNQCCAWYLHSAMRLNLNFGSFDKGLGPANIPQTFYNYGQYNLPLSVPVFSNHLKWHTWMVLHWIEICLCCHLSIATSTLFSYHKLICHHLSVCVSKNALREEHLASYLKNKPAKTWERHFFRERSLLKDAQLLSSCKDFKE